MLQSRIPRQLLQLPLHLGINLTRAAQRDANRACKRGLWIQCVRRVRLCITLTQHVLRLWCTTAVGPRLCRKAATRVAPTSHRASPAAARTRFEPSCSARTRDLAPDAPVVPSPVAAAALTDGAASRCRASSSKSLPSGPQRVRAAAAVAATGTAGSWWPTNSNGSGSKR